jgi:hypothetical protein
MTKVQSWTIALVATVALAASALVATGAASFAQEGSGTPTATPAATVAPTDDAGTETPEPEEGSSGDATPAPKEDSDGDGRPDGCPEKEQDAATTTETDA